MLEGIPVIAYIVVKVVRVCKKLILLDKEEYTAYMRTRKESCLLYTSDAADE